MAQQPTWETAGGYGYNREYSFTNTVAYNMYKLEAYKSNLEGIEMAEVYFGNTKAAEICDSQDNYSSAYVGSKAFISCPTGYTGFIYRNYVSTPTGNQLASSTRSNSPSSPRSADRSSPTAWLPSCLPI